MGIEMKEEALNLADELLETSDGVIRFCASAMIRRLVEELDKQGEPVAWVHEVKEIDFDGCQITVSNEQDDYYTIPLYTTPQTKPLSDDYVFVCKKCGDEIGIKYEPKPLSDEEIKQLAYQHRWNGDIEFARAIEAKVRG
jgi:hypothetical protein